MKNVFLFLIAATLLALSLSSQAQTSQMVDKMLGKAFKSAAKSDIAIPGLSNLGDALGGSGEALSKAVNKGLKGALKGGKKVLDWTTKDLNPMQLAKIATSGNPMSTLMEMKGKNLKKNLEGLIGNNLDKSGAMDLLSQAGKNIPGFDLDKLGGKEGFVSKLTDNAIGQLDDSAAKWMKNLNI